MKPLNLTGIDATAVGIIEELVAEIQKIDPDFIIGFYITGSIPVNDFHCNKSDIDFLILYSKIPGKEFQFQLNKVHKKIQKRLTKPDLSGFYLRFEELSSDNPQSINVLSFHEGRLSYSTFGMAMVTMLELKTIAHTVYGTHASDLPIAVGGKDIDDFLYDNINSYWKSWLRIHAKPGYSFLLLVFIPRLTEWVTLGVARQFFTLQTGKITSKTKAGYYCLNYLPHKYHTNIYEAIRIREDNKKLFYSSIKPSYYILPSVKRAKETLDCANFIIALFNQQYKEKYNEP